MIRTSFFVACLLMFGILIPISALLSPTHSSAASPSDFANANSAISSAFTAIHSAEQRGGNVTSLVAKLDTSLNLVQKAQAENATSPLQATADIQNATQIASQVLAQAPAIGQAGSSARQTLYEESIGSTIAILVSATLVYIYGARIYHLIWFFLYRNHSVRSPEERVG